VKKLMLALGLLICTNTIVYGMKQRIKDRLWTEIVDDIKDDRLSATQFFMLYSASPDVLNAPNGKGLYLLPVLLYNTTDVPDDRCTTALAYLMQNSGLNVTATNQHGRLLCNDASLKDEHKERLATILVNKNIPNTFTQTNDPINGITFHLKQPSRLAFISVTNYKLWIATTAIAVVAVVAAVIYKWCAKRAADNDDDTDGEQAEKTGE
jgi:hypothetical protein